MQQVDYAAAQALAAQLTASVQAPARDAASTALQQIASNLHALARSGAAAGADSQATAQQNLARLVANVNALNATLIASARPQNIAARKANRYKQTDLASFAERNVGPRGGPYRSLAAAGVHTRSDGALRVDEDEAKAAAEKDADGLQALVVAAADAARSLALPTTAEVGGLALQFAQAAAERAQRQAAGQSGAPAPGGVDLQQMGAVANQDPSGASAAEQQSAAS